MSRPSLLDGQAAHQHCHTQSSDTRKDSEAREFTPEVTTPVCEQKRKLNDLYVKIGRLWEENDALKENITALKEQELCDECKAKDTKIAQLEEQLYSTGEYPKRTKATALHSRSVNSSSARRLMIYLQQLYDPRTTPTPTGTPHSRDCVSHSSKQRNSCGPAI